MSQPKEVNSSSQFVAATATAAATTVEKPQPNYKAQLHEFAQKLRIQPPIYQIHNEGSDHQPKFRATVWVDNLSYTSQNTYLQRKLADLDVSKIALFATMQKIKNEALQLVREEQDKFSCKSILMELTVRLNIQKPTYETIPVGAPVSIFRSSVVFDNVSWTGEDCRSKRDAEHSAARQVILNYLGSDSDSANILSEIIRCKFRQFTELKDVAQNRVVQTGTIESASVPPESFVSVDVAQTQESAQEKEMTPPTSAKSVENIARILAAHYSSKSEVKTSASEDFVSLDVTPTDVPKVSDPTGDTTTSTPGPVPPALSFEDFARVAVALISSNLVQPVNSIPFPLAAAAQAMLVTPTSRKKRKNKNKKKAQKKMRVEEQVVMPPTNDAIPLSKVPTLSAQ